MSFNELEKYKYEEIIQTLINKRRPPTEIKDEIDISYEFTDYTIELFELREHWKNPKEKIRIPIAKTKFINKTKKWKIYWMRSDLKWHGYDPQPEVSNLEEFIKIIDADENCCFWG